MHKKDIFKKDVKARFKAAAKDQMHRFIMADKMMRGAVVHTTRVVNEMRANHELGTLETLLLGQAYTAGLLLCANLKGKDRVAMNIQCSGPAKGIDVESNCYGEVRGFLKNSRIVLKHPEKLTSLSPILGAGFLTVTKYLEDASTPYSGQVTMEYGTIAEDLANYFLKSEQVPTGFNLSVFFDQNDEVAGAGGIFLQAMTGVSPEKVIEAEKIMQQIQSVGESFSTGISPENLITSEFKKLDPQMLSATRVEFFCR
ncbi:MAG: Hsp33 family molecular chaperone HslO, partial [Desulfobacteraceae bacterium]|nr:Hsp33 family molecular chaperone HslO [Desulfobacteraceae bacterium]